MSPSGVATAASVQRRKACAPPRARSRFHVWLALWVLASRAAALLLVNVGDMVSFAVWFSAAIWCRARSEVHKRLMVVAPVVHDWTMRRRIHPVYTIGSITLFLFGLRFVAGSETWLRIGRPIIDALR